MSKKGHNSGVSGERLKSFIERIERLEEDKRAVSEDIAQVYSEAKGVGFDTKIIRLIVKERRLTIEQRYENEALLDIYKAAIGMLDGTPLGQSAIERLQKKKPPKEDSQTDLEEAIEEDQPEDQNRPRAPSAEDIEKARAEGRSAASAGLPVTRNPYPAHNPCRAAWDEGWCHDAGSDGMDIPDAWRASKKPKKGDEKKDPDDKGGEGA